MYYNGKALKIKGVNRHEFHPRTGRTIDRATTELDLKGRRNTPDV